MLQNGRPKLRNSLLAALVDGDRSLIERHLETVRLPRGVLLRAGDRVTHAYFPLDCLISLGVAMDDGGSAETASIGREGMDGYMVALGDHRSLCRSLVQVEGWAARMPVDRLEAAFATSPPVRELFLAYVQALLGQVSQLAACNALHPTEARLCRVMLLLRDRLRSDLLPFTQETLAEMLGVQRPTVSLVARTLQTAGLIRSRRGSVEIADGPGLEEASCECYATIRGHYRRLLPLSFGDHA
jgi:CRP-like cAMP-binding protein